MPDPDLAHVRDSLVAAGITGPHQSHARRANVTKIKALLEGDPGATFGLSSAADHSEEDVLGFMAQLTGCSPEIAELDHQDTIDPDLTMRGIVEAAERLRDAAKVGASLVIATGHPTGMLEHHVRVAEAYVQAGGKILRPREGETFPYKKRHAEVRYVGGVGVLADWGSLHHTHRSLAMEALLESQPWPDLVFADHGFAGAAIERGIPTVAVMDINDHALAVAWGEGRDVIIVPMDDNRRPRLYEASWRTFEAIILDR
ncbi:MAG: hypothetical protein GEU78_08630 [Actinobacteria bacterium]|nr:hypothetical protein [Actinomycetota bacterium]